MSLPTSPVKVGGRIAGTPKLSAIEGTLLLRFTLVDGDTGDDTVLSFVIQAWDTLAHESLHMDEGDEVDMEGEIVMNHSLPYYAEELRAEKLKVRKLR